ncbi:hypothetical protein [Lichenicoccus sp.]|uniref:hypothetical protein n=1 Tax=Lichenicoccus sp. TaxID=2781899 RepID=UPI003D13D145
MAWLLVAAAIMALHQFLITFGFGQLPNVFVGSVWNWQGKLLALTATLCIAALPGFGWRRVGLTLTQAEGSLRPATIAMVAYCALFSLIALFFPGGHTTSDEVAFQLTMPGLEEEPFYRGVLFLALDQAFRGRVRLLGAD